MSQDREESSRAPADATIGRRLRELRKRHRVSGVELAARIGVNQSTISRIETGAIDATPDEVERIVVALGESRDVVTDILRRTKVSAAAAGIGASQPGYRDYEDAARTIRLFQPAIIPGLLQTSAYAQAIYAGVARLHGLDYEALGAGSVALRMERQKLLYEKGRSFVFVIMESVLDVQIASNAVMLAQLETLERLSALPSVTLSIVPTNRRLLMAPLSSLEIFDSTAALSETNTSVLEQTDPEEIDALVQVFAHFEENATTAIAPILERHRRAYIARMARDTGIAPSE